MKAESFPQNSWLNMSRIECETTSTVWLGLTTGCARCHDHKYDPIKMKDFYSLFAFFHNLPEKGKDGSVAPAPNMSVYTNGSASEHETLRKEATRLKAGLDVTRKCIRRSFSIG